MARREGKLRAQVIREAVKRLHFNDAYGKWDDDMLPGTVSSLGIYRVFVCLLNSNYNGWIGLDIFPYREGPLRACSMAVDNLRSLISTVKKVNVQSLKSAQETRDSISTHKRLYETYYFQRDNLLI